MEHINELPIFCDNCATLALAELDAAPLCEHCLMEAISLADDKTVADKISPLQFKQPRMMTPSRHSYENRTFAA